MFGPLHRSVRPILGAAVITAASMSYAVADYIVTGPITGDVCSFGGFACRSHKVDATLGSDGRYYSLATTYKDVSEFHDGRCWMRLNASGTLGTAFGLLGLRPKFYELRPDGQYERIDPEYLTFQCVKR